MGQKGLYTKNSLYIVCIEMYFCLIWAKMILLYQIYSISRNLQALGILQLTKRRVKQKRMMSSSSFAFLLVNQTEYGADEITTWVIYLSKFFLLNLFFQVSIENIKSLKQKVQISNNYTLLRYAITYSCVFANDVAENYFSYPIEIKSEPIILVYL